MVQGTEEVITVELNGEKVKVAVSFNESSMAYALNSGSGDLKICIVSQLNRESIQKGIQIAQNLEDYDTDDVVDILTQLDEQALFLEIKKIPY